MSVSCSVVCDSLWPDGLQPASLLCPWNSPGKNTGVGCIPFSRGSSWPRDWIQVSCIAGRFFYRLSYQGSPKYECSVQFSSVAQSCPTLCDPMNRSTPGLPVYHQLPEFTQIHIYRVSIRTAKFSCKLECLEMYRIRRNLDIVGKMPCLGISGTAVGYSRKSRRCAEGLCSKTHPYELAQRLCGQGASSFLEMLY